MLMTPLPFCVWIKSSKIQRRFAEEFVGALRFEGEQVALDRAGAGGRDIAVLRFELIGVVGDVLQHRAQILQIEQQQPAFIGDLENHVEHAFLRVVQIEQTPEQQRPHFRNGRAHRMSVFAKHIPEHDRARFAFEIGNRPAPSRARQLSDCFRPAGSARRDRLSRPP